MKILHFLTNKTALGVFFVLLAIAGGGWIVHENTPRAPAAVSLSQNSSSEHTGGLLLGADGPAGAAARQDSDSDGLYDWEEGLWNTDPNNPDSDGDGTPDGEEVRADRNPAEAGPGDVLEKGSEATIEESISNFLSDENRTETEKIALQLFRGYANLRGTNGFGTAQESQLINQLVSQQVATPSDIKSYTQSDLSIVTSETEEIRRTYKQQHDGIALRLADITEHELVTFERAIQSEQESDIARLDTVRAVYTDVLRRLLSMDVPRSAGATHLSLTNGYALMLSGLDEMRVALEDPIRGTSGMQMFLEGVEQVHTAYRTLHAYFDTYQLTGSGS